MKPRALDLFCGKGGATIGLQKSGWHVTGMDIEAWEGYPGDEFIKGDVREYHAKPGQFQFVWASPPCQEFSYRSFPFKRCRELAKNVPPDKSLWEAALRIAKEAGCPIVIENVRGAQPYMGKAVAHYGSFYLWGDVPALLPIGKPRKGFVQVDVRVNGERIKQFQGNVQAKSICEFAGKRDRKGFAGEYERPNRIKYMARGESQYTSSNSTKRAEWSAKVAMIPPELGEWIGKCFLP